MRNYGVLTGTVLVLLLLCGNAMAFSVLNRVPAVNGRVVDQDGQGLAGAKVVVKFLGTKDSLLDENKKVFEIKRLEATTDDNGDFHLDGCMINLPQLKAKFIAAGIEVKKDGYDGKLIQAVNMRALGGAIGVFIVGIVDAQGEFDGEGPGIFSTFAHAYKTMKDSKFGRVYKKLLAEPIRLERADGGSRRTENFKALYDGLEE